MWYLIFYQIVFCLSTNREVNKHHNSHCLKTINSDNPRLLGFWANIHLFCYYSRLERNSRVVWGAYSFRFSYCLTFRLQHFGLRRFDSRQRRTHFIVANSHLSVHWIRSVRPLTRTITFVQVLFISIVFIQKNLWGISRTAHPVPYSCNMRQLSECESEFCISLFDELIYCITLKKAWKVKWQ